MKRARMATCAVMSVILLDPRGEGGFAGVGNVSARLYPESPRMLATFAKASNDASLILFAHRGGPRFSEERVRSLS
jgi:hypothetical protein